MLSKVLAYLFGYLKDTTGKASWTYTIGVPAFTVITLKYLFSGMHLVATVFGQPVDLELGAMSGIDYATAAGCVLAYITARAFTPGIAPAAPPAERKEPS